MSDDVVKRLSDPLPAWREAQAAEITRLRAELATARREGMEEAAKIVINLSISTPSVIAAAIRAAAREVK